MKNIIISVAAILAMLALASCNKEPLPVSEIAGNDVIIAYTEDNIMKTTLSGNDTEGYDVVWSKGDKISIGGNVFELTEGEGTANGRFRGTLPPDGTYTAYYPETYDGTNWTTHQKYVEGFNTGSPMKAELTISGGKVTDPLSFKNAGGILRLTLKGNATVRDITFSGADNDIYLTCGAGVQLNDTDGKVFHIAVPAGEFSEEAGFEFYFNDGNSINKRMKSGTKLVIERSKMTRASMSGINSTGPIDMLPGVFRVSESRKVRFSKGNLRYTVDSRTWSFYDKQYNCGPLDSVDDKEISLFTWGYNAEQSILPYGETFDNVSRTTGDLEQDEDWGCTIGDGYTWRTLTKAEWDYLFKTRTDAKQKYGTGTVSGIHGLIILPDTFEDPRVNYGSLPFKPGESWGRWDKNVYAGGGDWDAMEYAGAVFLPHAGLREGDEKWTQVSNYWSSSAYPDKYSADSYIIDFFEYGCFTVEYKGRGLGCSVRLVTDTDATYTYSVTFNSNGISASGIPAPIKKIEYGATIAEPASIPTADGYIFTGWFKDKKCTIPWIFDSDAVTKHTTIYAGWAEVPLPGKFTVNSTGKQIRFSKGNLWADSSNNLHFEEMQYNFNSKYESSHVSHFTWASSLSGAVGTTGSGNYLFCDENHMVSVGISGPVYYALSKDEWMYLLNDRENKPWYGGYAKGITYGGVEGIVIYPDDYRGEQLEDGTEIENLPSGCVFLPAAGWRDGYDVELAGEFGGYRSSSATSKNEPYSVIISATSVDLSEPGDPNDGFSIRLVTNVK